MSEYKGNGGVGIVSLLTLLFLGLKLGGVIDWSWWWVFSPYWILFSIVGMLFSLVFVFGLRSASTSTSDLYERISKRAARRGSDPGRVRRSSSKVTTPDPED